MELDTRFQLWTFGIFISLLQNLENSRKRYESIGYFDYVSFELRASCDRLLLLSSEEGEFYNSIFRVTCSVMLYYKNEDNPGM